MGFKLNRKMNKNLKIERSIKINKSVLQEIIKELRNTKKLSLNTISKNIGTNIKNLLYGYTKTIKESCFRRLEVLYQKEIPNELIEIRRITKLKNSDQLAEMIGILLGDGSLNKRIYRIQVSLNGVKEFNYVKDLMKILFRLESKEVWERDKKDAIGIEEGMFLYINSKAIFLELISKGLKLGNKVKNQVCVPSWIKKNFFFIISCLKGLFYTDGSISIVSARGSLILDFSNASLPLVKDFKEMCELLEIKTSPRITKREWRNSITNIVSTTYRVYIGSKSEIVKFLKIIKPKKWEFQSDNINKRLKAIGSSIEKALQYK
jgi:sulfopyruvate decarboxylase TPP-binding subunit